MPPARRQTLRQRRTWGPAHRRHLESGFDPFRTAFRGRENAFDEAGARDCWHAIGGMILTDWIVAYPGTRPWAWWRYDAPERRHCTNGVHPFDDPDRQAKVDEVAAQPGTHPRYAQDAVALDCGTPNMVIVLADWHAEFESQEDYLRRLGLLSEAEESALSAERAAAGRQAVPADD